ncbi:hypothetical protein LX77_01789 [Gelidibacter algens]|jgi:hypothetical protein|uniref:Uncharacterized protein n=1 Tax=Gelidibacter algens TaxID=49280 RepID=A0A1A7QY60_9FLAO|nr:hypothetical protein [Gelidibacter algens]OBX24955.1 hypothetical protein A9996_12730 [Gelidibacter algens]RAJ24793.1 hypothetical protein LX77_01789 [Gelidibacter algens]
MENRKEKKQNNRKQDETRPQEVKDKTTPSEKEWDPDRDPNEEALSDDEKLERNRDVRKPNDSDSA